MSAWDGALIVLLVGSVALMFWYESTDDPVQRRAMEWIDLALVVFFVGEWGWRVAHADAKGRYAARHSWELLGMVPLMAPVPGFLRFLRLFRLVRILRVFGKVGDALGTWERIARESSILKIGAVSGALTIIGALLVLALERNAPDAHIQDWRTAVWWAVVTVTTVGYGDVTPVTGTGRFVAALLMVTGIGTIGALASSVASVLITQKDEAREEAADGASEAAKDPLAPPVMAGGLTRQLQDLSALHDRGKLTDAEYAQAKARLLGG